MTGPAHPHAFLAWWCAFVAVQAAACILPQFANVHSNLAPLVLGIFLLMPGSLVFVAGVAGSVPWVQGAIAVLLNITAWYAGWRVVAVVLDDRRR